MYRSLMKRINDCLGLAGILMPLIKHSKNIRTVAPQLAMSGWRKCVFLLIVRSWHISPNTAFNCVSQAS
jgi:hypothetical protein